MNRKEWLECDNNEIKWYWRTKCEEIRKTLKYNPDPKATHKHHLFNTPEQIKYNNSHYEMWGFNEDGTFEYGKYIIFVTPEEHSKLHSESEITKYRKSESQKNRHLNNPVSEETRKKLREKNLGKKNPMYGKHPSDETRKKMSESQKARWTDERRVEWSKKYTGKNSPLYGKTLSNETKDKISQSTKLALSDPATRKKLSDSHKGKHHTEENKEKRKLRMQELSDQYKSYKANGGVLSWNNFQKLVYNKYTTMEDDHA